MKVDGRDLGVGTFPTALFINVTAVDPAAAGFLTVHSCNSDRPLASHVNYGPGDVAPNAVLAPFGQAAEFCIFTLAETDLIVDLNGFVPGGEQPAAVTPTRLLETRVGPNNKTVDGKAEGIGRQGARTTYELVVAGRGGVPDHATSVLLNLTAIAPGGASFLTVFPCGADLPVASHVNYGPGDVAPNAVLAKVGDGGKVCIYTLAETDLIADINGYVG